MNRLVCLVGFFFLFCCTRDGDDKSECQEVACTEEFRTITLFLKNSTGEPISLDRFKVTNLNIGEDLTREVSDFELGLMRKNGSYPLFGDEFSRSYQNESLRLNFKGFKNGKEIVYSDYTVGADCCHVILIEGETDLVVD